MILTTDDIRGYIAIAIRNNKSGVISAMNSTGNNVPSGISNAELVARLWDVFAAQGITGLQNVLSRVPIDKVKITTEEAEELVTRFRGTPPANTKLVDVLKGVGDYFGDLLGGSSVSGGTVTNVSAQSALSPTTITLIVIIGLILMVLFRKFIALVVGIIVIILAVVLYGIFAKNIQTTITGGGTTTHGGIGSVVLSWLTGKP